MRRLLATGAQDIRGRALRRVYERQYMYKLITAISLLFALTNAHAQEDIRGRAGMSTDAEVERFAQTLCSTLKLEEGKASVGDAIKNRFLDRLSITTDTPDYGLPIAELWNAISPGLICRNEHNGARGPEHFLKRVVDLALTGPVFDEFLLYDHEEYPIDVNAYEIVNGAPETFLDFLEERAEDEYDPAKFGKVIKYDPLTIQDLIDTITDPEMGFNAKRGAEVCPEC